MGHHRSGRLLASSLDTLEDRHVASNQIVTALCVAQCWVTISCDLLLLLECGASSHHNNAENKCYERYLLCLHKMGFVLTGELVKGYKIPAKKPKEIKGGDCAPLLLPAPKADFCAAMITRNMIDSIMSGYLYHKAGRERWLDSVGRPWQPKWRPWQESKWSWERNFTFPGSFPPRQGRSICKCLEEESEQDGVRVCVKHATLARCQLVLCGCWERATRLSDDPLRGRALFQCCEDFLNRNMEMSEVQKTIVFLFPEESSGILLQSRPKERGPALRSTSHSATLRARLRNLIRHLDVNVFNSALAKHQAVLQCD